MNKLGLLHRGEEELRSKTEALVAQDQGRQLHVAVVEAAMDVADALRTYETEDKDLKAIQLLGIALFNTLAGCFELTMSGYGQCSVLGMRFVIETGFLLSHFASNRSAIEEWRLADDQALRRRFSPVEIRKLLDTRDGYTGKKRHKHYRLLSELASHPSLKLQHMLRPTPDSNIQIGPFIEPSSFDAVLAELAKAAVLAGETLMAFFPNHETHGLDARSSFASSKRDWLTEFYPDSEP